MMIDAIIIIIIIIIVITNRNQAIKSRKSQAKSRCHPQARSPNIRAREARRTPKETRQISNGKNRQLIEQTSIPKQKSQKGQNTSRKRIVRQVDLEETVEVNPNNRLSSR